MEPNLESVKLEALSLERRRARLFKYVNVLNERVQAELIQYLGTSDIDNMDEETVDKAFDFIKARESLKQTFQDIYKRQTPETRERINRHVVDLLGVDLAKQMYKVATKAELEDMLRNVAQITAPPIEEGEVEEEEGEEEQPEVFALPEVAMYMQARQQRDPAEFEERSTEPLYRRARSPVEEEEQEDNQEQEGEQEDEQQRADLLEQEFVKMYTQLQAPGMGWRLARLHQYMKRHGISLEDELTISQVERLIYGANQALTADEQAERRRLIEQFEELYDQLRERGREKRLASFDRYMEKRNLSLDDRLTISQLERLIRAVNKALTTTAAKRRRAETTETRQILMKPARQSREQLLELAHQTKENTEAAIAELKDELKRMSGRVVEMKKSERPAEPLYKRYSMPTQESISSSSSSTSSGEDDDDIEVPDIVVRKRRPPPSGQ